ncbi:MAG: leucine-rich repeat domain-containing protein, partial [Lachnospiraceae bacterium]|nr:leucine-rich repeat domain-containing protein [Lachnospiraceae bacterium]
PSGKSEVKLPEGVTSIGNGAFSGSGLTSIELPEGVTSIGDYAFSSCDNLTIYGVENSYVHTYALENNIPFKPVSDLDSSEYVIDIVSDSTISASDFEAILNENKTKNVVIKTNNDVTFTFAKGTMQVIEGKNSYDFGTIINKIYSSDLPSYATKDNFVLQITYNYSGELPAEASVRFLAGTEYAGKTLYYSLLKEDNTFAEVQKVVVDDEGYVTVKQNHCSSYLLTSEEPKTQENIVENNKPTDNTTNSSESTDNSESANNSETTSSSESKENSVSKGDSPKTGDNARILFYLVICIAAAGIICVSKKCKYQNSSK